MNTKSSTKHLMSCLPQRMELGLRCGYNNTWLCRAERLVNSLATG